MNENTPETVSSEPFPPPSEPPSLPVEEPVVVGAEERPASRRERMRSFIGRALRYLLALLLVLGAGALLVFLLVTVPLQQQNRGLETDLAGANQKVSALETQVADLSGLESENRAIQAEMDQAQLHVNILKARTDVATALLALAKNDPAKARVALSRTPETLENMAGLLDASQQEIAAGMQERLRLALEGLEDDVFAAESDLNVLATSLLELENAYFTVP